MIRIGYVAHNLTLGMSGSHTSRLQNLNKEKITTLINQNLGELETIIDWNKRHEIYLYRISSVIIPFASHESIPLDWKREFSKKIYKIGEQVKKTKMRVSMHPGQYTVLNSPDESIVNKSITELKYHADFLDLMELSSAHKIILHIGGKYGDKEASVERFCSVYRKLPINCKKRLVIENDDKNYNIEDCFDISRRLNIPVVYDNLHHQVNHPENGDKKNIRKLLEKVFETWKPDDGRPKIHFSTQAKDARRGHHALSIDADEFGDFLAITDGLDFDIMLETKDKDKSALRLKKLFSI